MILNESFCRGAKKADTPMEMLMREMVVFAIDDYIAALNGRWVDKIDPKQMIKDCERFFRSELFLGLCNLNPEWLINAIKEDVKNETNRFQTEGFKALRSVS